MGSVLQAFRYFFKVQTGDRAAGVGLDSCLDDPSLIFYRGRYFCHAVCHRGEFAILKEMAMLISSKIVDPLAFRRDQSFSKRRTQTGVDSIFPEGLLGHGSFRRGFQASYTDQAHLFLAIFRT